MSLLEDFFLLFSLVAFIFLSNFVLNSKMIPYLVLMKPFLCKYLAHLYWNILYQPDRWSTASTPFLHLWYPNLKKRCRSSCSCTSSITFLEVHTCVIPGLFCTWQFHPRVLLKDVSTAIQLALSHTAIWPIHQVPVLLKGQYKSCDFVQCQHFFKFQFRICLIIFGLI